MSARGALEARPVRATIEIPAEAVRIEAPAPAIISQENCSYVGMTKGVFLATIKKADFPLEVICLGKLRGVDAPAFIAWMKRQTERPAARGIAVKSAAPGDGAAEFLGELGLRLVGNGRAR